MTPDLMQEHTKRAYAVACNDAYGLMPQLPCGAIVRNTVALLTP